MAGTRLVLQTMVLVHLVGLVALSVRYGLCRPGCPTGNLTKDLPLVPGVALGGGGNGNAAVLEAQFWEIAVCHPIDALLRSALENYGVDTDDDNDNRTTGISTDADDGTGGFRPGDYRLELTLAVETTAATETDLPKWIDAVGAELDRPSEGDDDRPSTFSALLRAHPMELAVLPPLPGDDPLVRWLHYKEHRRQRGRDHDDDQTHRLMVYIPASALAAEGVPDHEAIAWKAFDAIPGEDKGDATTMARGVATLVLPYTTSTETDDPALTSSSSSRLQPLVEDWMARAIVSDRQSQPARRSVPSSSGRPGNSHGVRLTREFPLEHFMAVFLPLVFPLVLPMIVSWIKEWKRYKRLTAASAAAAATANEPPAPEASSAADATAATE